MLRGLAGIAVVAASFAFYFAFGDRSVPGVILDHVPGIGEDAGKKFDSATAGFTEFPFAFGAVADAERQRDEARKFAEGVCNAWTQGQAKPTYRFTHDALICTAHLRGHAATLTLTAPEGTCRFAIATRLDGAVVDRRSSSFEDLGLSCPQG